VAYRIISSKGATCYGIASDLARLVDVILHDQRSMLRVCTPVDEIAGVEKVVVALPHLLIVDEKAALRGSASVVKEDIIGSGALGVVMTYVCCRRGMARS